MSGLTSVVAIAAGANHSLALKSNGTVFAWGQNDYGQIGDGSSGNERLTPVQVSGLTGVIAIAAGAKHSLAVKSNGTVFAWGDNYYGQIGDGSSGNSRPTPVQVSGLTGVIAVAGGESHSLALKSDATVAAWGYNASGQIGDGSNTQRLTPVAVTGLSRVIAISAGSNHSLALRQGASSGTLWAWGANGSGQLGTGTLLASNLPVRGLSAAIAMDGGDLQTLALKADGSAWGFGANENGQLGVGVATPREPLPQRLAKSAELLGISSGSLHGVALMSDGTARTWGSSLYGQLGDGSQYTTKPEPQAVPNLTLVTNDWMMQDTDLDGLSNTAEYRLGSDPLLADTNGDGVSDGAAILSGRSVTSADADADGLLNTDEIRLGTDPFRADTDGDGTLDGADCYPLDPTRTCISSDPNDHTPPVITLTEPSNAVLLP